MGAIWSFLGSPLAFRFVSGFFCAYVSIGTLGRTGSYLDAFNTATLFLAIWVLGYYSALQSARRGEVGRE